MIYLIVSFVAGIIFLISGKVKFGKTLYLEGTKARIAGLIFLVPVGLAIFVLMAGLMYESAGNIADGQAYEQSLNNWASTLVRNGILIGLAYINFHSVSREAKERGGCLTYGLAYAAFIAALLAYYSLTGFPSAPVWFRNVSIGLSILEIISLIGIWLWSKWGVFAYVSLVLVSPILAFLNTQSLLPVFLSIIQSMSIVLVLYFLVKPKWQFFE